MPAYFIVTEEPIDGFDLFGNGEALAFASDLLDQLAADAGVRPLMDFFSMEPEEVETLFGMLGLDPTGAELPDESGESGSPPTGTATATEEIPDMEEPPAEVWFQPREGLATVQALIAAIRDRPETADAETDTPPSATILDNLIEFEAVFTQLVAAGIRWHLMVEL